MKVSRHQLTVPDDYKLVEEQKRRGHTNQNQPERWGAASKLTLNLRHGVRKALDNRRKYGNPSYYQ